jgi:hypothetical protein
LGVRGSRVCSRHTHWLTVSSRNGWKSFIAGRLARLLGRMGGVSVIRHPKTPPYTFYPSAQLSSGIQRHFGGQNGRKNPTKPSCLYFQ